MKKINPLTVRQQTNRIRKVYEQATIQEIESGLTWYNEARVFCTDMSTVYKCTVFEVAQITSLLSPQKKWEQNKEEVEAFLKLLKHDIIPLKGFFASKATMQECKDVILKGYVIPSHRTKTFSFAHNIAFDFSMCVTIDRHAIKIAYGEFDAKPIGITEKRYRQAQAAYETLATELNVKPYELQAITWVTYKRITGR